MIKLTIDSIAEETLRMKGLKDKEIQSLKTAKGILTNSTNDHLKNLIDQELTQKGKELIDLDEHIKSSGREIPWIKNALIKEKKLLNK